MIEYEEYCTQACYECIFPCTGSDSDILEKDRSASRMRHHSKVKAKKRAKAVVSFASSKSKKAENVKRPSKDFEQRSKRCMQDTKACMQKVSRLQKKARRYK